MRRQRPHTPLASSWTLGQAENAESPVRGFFIPRRGDPGLPLIDDAPGVTTSRCTGRARAAPGDITLEGWTEMRRLKPLFLACVVGLLGGVVVDAASAQPAPVNATSVRTCVNLTNGSIRIIGTVSSTSLQWTRAPRDCGPREQELDWPVGAGASA